MKNGTLDCNSAPENAMPGLPRLSSQGHSGRPGAKPEVTRITQLSRHQFQIDTNCPISIGAPQKISAKAISCRYEQSALQNFFAKTFSIDTNCPINIGAPQKMSAKAISCRYELPNQHWRTSKFFRKSKFLSIRTAQSALAHHKKFLQRQFPIETLWRASFFTKAIFDTQWL